MFSPPLRTAVLAQSETQLMSVAIAVILKQSILMIRGELNK